jgi:hypothetical protein
LQAARPGVYWGEGALAAAGWPVGFFTSFTIAVIASSNFFPLAARLAAWGMLSVKANRTMRVLDQDGQLPVMIDSRHGYQDQKENKASENQES